MVSFFSADYFEVKKKGGLSQFQTMMAYLGGSALQTVGDNPVTAYRQLVQQYAKDLKGEPPQCPRRCARADHEVQATLSTRR